MNIFNANRLKRPSLSRQLFGDPTSIFDGLLIIKGAVLGLVAGHPLYTWVLRRTSSADHLRRHIAAGRIGKALIDHARDFDPQLHIDGAFDNRTEEEKDEHLLLPANGDEDGFIQLAQKQRVDQTPFSTPQSSTSHHRLGSNE